VKNPRTKGRKQFLMKVSLARKLWPNQIHHLQTKTLRALCEQYNFRVITGDLLLLEGRWYVTHAGLLRLARRERCTSIRVQAVREFCNLEADRWVFKATVHGSSPSNSYVGYGDANPLNVSPLVRGAEMRVAETRAVNRALRKAYGIGLCSVEELGWEPPAYGLSASQKTASPANSNGRQSGHTSLRDRLCLLIRQHQLDANLVKAYAADSCGTPNLRDASRKQIETFITNLGDWASKDRPALLCKLNSYSRSQEVSP
jgi:hypothetical protein